MQPDIRGTYHYQATEAFYKKVRQPGAGLISDAADLHISDDGEQAVFTGTVVDTLDSTPTTRICLTSLVTGDTRVLTSGPNNDRMPKFSPGGRVIAFLSDRHRAGDMQLYLLHPRIGAARLAARVDGWVEYLHWSPAGQRILLGVAGHGADLSSGQGGVTSKRDAANRSSWMPTVETGDESCHWRRAWVYELMTGRVRQVTAADTNVWEAVWCGNEAVAAVVSPGPSEGLWYTAGLALIEIGESGKRRDIYKPQDQIGWPAACPLGKHLAIVEAISSDRGLVAGDLRLIDTASGELTHVDTAGVDVTYTEWRSTQHLLVAGHRGFETVVGMRDAAAGTFTEVWASSELSAPGDYVAVSGLNETGDCALLGESFTRAPEIAVIRAGEYRTVKSFDQGYGDLAKAIEAVERISWSAPDGREIQGWLLQPKGVGPHPLVMNIHGGPVWSWRPLWLGRPRYAPFWLLVQQGYAVFLPNPRGSSGRGQDFARQVLGEMGGADTYDCLSGIDHLVAGGIADPTRLGVTGVSYGGFMASWLITQDSRFAAAVPVSPVTNQVTEHLLSNIPHFVRLFLDDTYTNPGGKYFRYSPIMHAHKAKTPTLNICGALDRCTPAEEAAQFHNALLENGVSSVLVTYPEEGHGITHFPAAIDFAARLLVWFGTHLHADGSDTTQARGQPDS